MTPECDQLRRDGWLFDVQAILSPYHALPLLTIRVSYDNPANLTMPVMPTKPREEQGITLSTKARMGVRRVLYERCSRMSDKGELEPIDNGPEPPYRLLVSLRPSDIHNTVVFEDILKGTLEWIEEQYADVGVTAARDESMSTMKVEFTKVWAAIQTDILMNTSNVWQT